MKNKLSDLNNHLFAQLERLSDEDLTDDQLAKEVKRSYALVAVSEQVTTNARLLLEAKKFIAEHGGGEVRPPDMMLENKSS